MAADVFGLKNESTRLAWLTRVLRQIPQGSRILDAGAGECQYQKLCSHLNYVSQDFAKYNGKGDGKGLQKGRWNQREIDIISEITNIPEPDDSFDAVLCSEVLEHLPQPVLAIKEFSRLLKKGGYLILTAPFSSLTHYSPYYFYSGFSRNFYETFLSKEGFEIIEISPNGNFFEYLAQEIMRLPDVSLRYCGRRIGYISLIFIKIFLRILRKLSSAESASSELLCFGWHILAKKKD